MKKVLSELDFFLPFCQHAPSLANARRKIYADIDQFPGKDGVGFLMFLHFMVYSLGRPLHNLINTSGSTHLLIGESFGWRDTK